MQRTPSLASFAKRRHRECRLTQDRALKSLDEASEFLAERGLLTRMPDSALPSLFGACHEAPGKVGGRGFDLWPRTKWIWSFQLAARAGTLLTKLHRGKSLYLTTETARLFDPLVRQAMVQASGDEKRMLAHLEQQRDSTMEDLELELGWDRKHLRRIRERLERVGAVLTHGLVFENESEWHLAPLRRWDQVVREAPAAADPLGAILVAAMRAAVLTPETDLQKWFSWPIPDGTVDRLVREGRLRRPAAGWLATAN